MVEIELALDLSERIAEKGSSKGHDIRTVTLPNARRGWGHLYCLDDE